MGIPAVFREAAVEAEPCNAAFNNPGETSDFEGSLPTLDDLRTPAVASKLLSELTAFMASIGDNSANGRPERRQPGQQSAASPSVRHIGWFNAVGDRKAEDITQDMPVSSFHPLVSIEATNATSFSCFHRLAVHDDHCRIRLSTRCRASLRIECTMEQYPNTSYTQSRT